MHGNQTFTDIGQPTIMVTDDRQHGLDQWAKATTNEIFNTCELTGEKLATAEKVKCCIAAILIDYYDQAIESEQHDLLNKYDQCDFPINPVRFATEAMMEIQSIQTEEWNSVLKSVVWSEAALHALCTHMASAMHIERLWFADDNPSNQSAQTYKLNQGST